MLVKAYLERCYLRPCSIQGSPQQGSLISQLTRFLPVGHMEELVYQQNVKTIDVLLNQILDVATRVKDFIN
jgi:hypothetical protein